MTDFQLKDTRGVDPKWIELRILRSWLKGCDTKHSGHCKVPPWSAAFGPQRLIDVNKFCLVPAHEGCRYAALSYVWGQVETLKTTKDNLSFLQEPLSLKAHSGYLPRTIKDTMRLVSLLRINYLWVDCLCIVQDDKESLHYEIGRMGDIYQNAYLVVAAANGWDANQGLRGIPTVTEPRSLAASDLHNLGQHLKDLDTLPQPFWYTRGWTFQEMVLARRLIVFHYQLVFWRCGSAARHEFSITKYPISNFNQEMITRYCCEGDGFVSHPWPDVHQFLNHVKYYNRRTLRYPEDVLRAFSGLLTSWSRSFDGGFICGLPQMFFDDALLWQGNTTLARRRHLSRPGQAANFPPSWSWVGWQGEIDIEEWAKNWDYLLLQPRVPRNAPPFWKLKSTVQWSYGTNKDSKSRRIIDVSSHRYKHSWRLVAYPVVPLPRGWSVSGRGTKVVYRYQDFPHIQMQYPIPISSRQAPMWKPEDGCLLFGQTRTADFSALKPPSLGSWTEIGIDGKLFGHLLVDEHADIEMCYLNLVELSAGSTWQSLYSSQLLYSLSPEDLARHPERFAKYHFYNVLWVEWQDGIAYRKGIGRVERKAWEQSAKKIDLVLG